MTDREMLENAAKAAGVKVPTKEDYPYAYIDQHGIHRDISCGGDGSRMSHWNPLSDDGDALRLAVKLGLSVDIAGPVSKAFRHDIIGFCETNGTDHCAATRRAIVRAAAEIGRGMA